MGALSRAVSRVLNSLISLAVERKKIPNRCVGGTRRRHGHGHYVELEHVMMALGGSLVGTYLLVSTREMRPVRWGFSRPWWLFIS